eukprot:9490626-Pyramimonas_sp.AAC.1
MRQQAAPHHRPAQERGPVRGVHAPGEGQGPRPPPGPDHEEDQHDGEWHRPGAADAGELRVLALGGRGDRGDEGHARQVRERGDHDQAGGQQ